MKALPLARSICPILVVGAALCGAAIQSVDAQSTQVAALREQAAYLEREAVHHKEAGRHEEARELMRHVEEIRAEARRVQSELTEARAHQPRVAVERELSKRELQELRERAWDRDDDAPWVKERMVERERGQARHPRSIHLMDHGEIERRAHHLKVAIENLHAAGLHEPAERLATQLDRMWQRLAEMQPARPIPPRDPMEAIDELRAQMRELHRNLRQLRAELDEIRRRQ